MQRWTGLCLGFCPTLGAWACYPMTYYFLQLLAPNNAFYVYRLIQHQSRRVTGPELNVILRQASCGLPYFNIWYKLNTWYCITLIKPATCSIFTIWQERKLTRGGYILLSPGFGAVLSDDDYSSCRAHQILCAAVLGLGFAFLVFL